MQIKATDTMQKFLTRLKEILKARVKDGDLSEADFNSAVKQASGHAGGTARWEAVREAAQTKEAMEFAYSRLDELPDPVRSSLPEDAQKVWLAAFNATYKDNKDDARSAAIAWSAVKRAGWKKPDTEAAGVKWIRATEPDELGADITAEGIIEAIEESRMSAFKLLSEVYLLSEDGSTGEVQIFPAVGKYKHPRYGEIDISPEFLSSVKKNFDSKIYQQELPLTIDLEHQSSLSGAAGWVKDLDIRGDQGMWATIEFNDRGQKLVAEDAYRYFSPEFYDKWTDPGSNEKYSNVLIGGALTNRPFFKGMTPVAVMAGEAFCFMEDAASSVEPLTSTSTPDPSISAAEDAQHTDAIINLMKDCLAKMAAICQDCSPEMEERMDAMMDQMGSMMGMMVAGSMKGMAEPSSALSGDMQNAISKMKAIQQDMPDDMQPDMDEVMGMMQAMASKMGKKGMAEPAPPPAPSLTPEQKAAAKSKLQSLPSSSVLSGATFEKIDDDGAFVLTHNLGVKVPTPSMDDKIGQWAKAVEKLGAKNTGMVDVTEAGGNTVFSITGDLTPDAYKVEEPTKASEHKGLAEDKTKTEDGESYPAEAYLYTPEVDKPSTWKLRIWENPADKVTRTQLGRAAAAFSPGGFRGQKVDLPAADKPAVLGKLRSLYQKMGAKPEEMPAYIRASLSEVGLSEAEASAVLVELELVSPNPQGGKEMGMTEEEARSFAEMQTGVKSLTERLEATERAREAAEASLKSASEQIEVMRRDAVRKQLGEFVRENRLAFQGEVDAAVDKLESLRGVLAEEQFQDYLEEKRSWHAQMKESAMLTPIAHSGAGATGAASEFQTAVRKAMSETPGLSEVDAISKVATEQPRLYQAYDAAHKARARRGVE